MFEVMDEKWRGKISSVFRWFAPKFFDRPSRNGKELNCLTSLHFWLDISVNDKRRFVRVGKKEIGGESASSDRGDTCLVVLSFPIIVFDSTHGSPPRAIAHPHPPAPRPVRPYFLWEIPSMDTGQLDWIGKNGPLNQHATMQPLLAPTLPASLAAADADSKGGVEVRIPTVIAGHIPITAPHLSGKDDEVLLFEDHCLRGPRLVRRSVGGTLTCSSCNTSQSVRRGAAPTLSCGDCSSMGATRKFGRY